MCLLQQLGWKLFVDKNNIFYFFYTPKYLKKIFLLSYSWFTLC